MSTDYAYMTLRPSERTRCAAVVSRVMHVIEHGVATGIHPVAAVAIVARC